MKTGCHGISPRGFDLHNVRLEEMQAFRTTILKARLGEFRKMFFHGRWMQRDVSTQKRETPSCVAALCPTSMVPMGPVVLWWKRKEFLWRGATRRRMLARCFGSGLLLAPLSLFLPLAFHGICTCSCVCVHVCVCAFGSPSSCPSLSFFLNHCPP